MSTCRNGSVQFAAGASLGHGASTRDSAVGYVRALGAVLGRYVSLLLSRIVEDWLIP